MEITVEHKCDSFNNCNWCSWYSHRRIGKGTGGLGNMRTSGDYSNYSIVEIGQNTEKGRGDLRSLTVTQTPVWSHQLTLMWRTPKRITIIIINKGLEDLEIRGQVETIKTTTFLRSARILWRALGTWGDLLSLKLQWETISLLWREKLSKK